MLLHNLKNRGPQKTFFRKKKFSSIDSTENLSMRQHGLVPKLESCIQEAEKMGNFFYRYKAYSPPRKEEVLLHLTSGIWIFLNTQFQKTTPNSGSYNARRRERRARRRLQEQKNSNWSDLLLSNCKDFIVNF